MCFLKGFECQLYSFIHSFTSRGGAGSYPSLHLGDMRGTPWISRQFIAGHVNCMWLEFNLWLHMRFIVRVEGLLSSFLHSPSTIRWEIASVTPCSFLSFILISPVSFLWHLLRSSRLWLPHFSTFMLLSLSSSSPSLYHWILMGSWPTNCILNMALCPALTFTGWVKRLRSSALNRGGSKKEETQWGSFHRVCLNWTDPWTSNLERWSLPLSFDRQPQTGISQNAPLCTLLWLVCELRLL